ncbi:MAG: RNase adapter RapZ [Alphaproteobacteria bacterium]
MATEQNLSEKMVILLTGMSGSGKSCFLKSLEDMGHETIDNLPLALLLEAVELDTSARPLAIGVDIRTRDFNGRDFLEKIQTLKAIRRLRVCLVFLDCDLDVLQKRYRETRRHHPLSLSQSTLPEVILKESRLLKEVRACADRVVDTSLLTPPELKAYVQKSFEVAAQKNFKVTFLSFAFPKGIPREADLVFDMRFLKNPYYLESLKPLTGQAPSIQHYLQEEPDFQKFEAHLQGILETVLPRFKREGRDYVTIGFGCTGGQHRSVFAAETFGAWLAKEGYTTYIHHRDMKTQSR